MIEKNGMPVGAATGYTLSDISVEEAVSMLKVPLFIKYDNISNLYISQDCFNFVAEREISTGDGLNVIISRAGKKAEKIVVPLRKD
jgi:hypothetical protein